MTSDLIDKSEIDRRGTATTVAASMMLLGGALTGLTVALPPAAQGSDPLILAIGACAMLIGAGMLARRKPASTPVLAAVAALGSIFITLMTHEAGHQGGAQDNGVLYLWVVVFAFNFLPMKAAIAELTAVGVGYAWALTAIVEGSDTGPTRWIVTMATLSLVAIVVMRLRESRDRVEAKLDRMARHDGLTETLNRAALEERAAVEFERSRRNGTPVSLMLVDVDGLKQLNDSRGHREGDLVLRRVAMALSSSIRRIDVVARIGGDEFAVLLPGINGEGVRGVAERISSSLQAAGSWRAGATLSIGVSSAPGDGQELTTLLAAADSAMYRVKRAGGDGIALAEDEQSSHVPVYD